MKGMTTAAGLVILLLGSREAAAVTGVFDTAGWSHFAPVEIPAEPVSGLSEFTLTPEVIDQAMPGLDDLRLLSGTGEETGYLLRMDDSRREAVPLELRLYNQVYLPGKQSSVTVDFGKKALKSKVQVITTGVNFRRRILIEGGDDGENFQKLREDAILFQVKGAAEQGGFERSIVEFPENDLRYLRLTVFNGQDDPERVEIALVKSWRIVAKPPETLPVGVVSTSVSEEKAATEITLDLGSRNLPLYEMLTNFFDRTFFRHVVVFGRNATERVIRKPVEDSPAAERRIQEPWEQVASGVVFRYPGDSSVDEALIMDLRGVRHRYLKLRIENGNDPPLHFAGARVMRLVRYLGFQAGQGASCRLFFGNPQAPRPSYDIANYAERLRGQGVSVAALGKAVSNPDYGRPPKPPPWSERHKGIIWAALLAVLVVLSLIIWRQIRTSPAQPQ